MLQGGIACAIQLAVCTALPLAWFFILFNQDARLIPTPIVVWAVTSITACLVSASLGD